MRTVILVPRRDGQVVRDLTWAWVRDWWLARFPDWDLYEGHHDDGPFNRSAAINRAAGHADWEREDGWDVAVIIDSDVICDPDHVRAGVEEAAKSGRMVLPFNVRKGLSQRGSQMVMAGYARSWDRLVQNVYTDMCSGVVIVRRSLWDDAGGFDEAFSGWGFEDDAAAAAFETFSGQPILKMPGECWHFWHPTALEGKRGTPTHARNKARADRYLAARGDKEATRALRRAAAPAYIAERGIPRILHRVVPELADPRAEVYWAAFQALHPGWTFMTHRDPLVPAEWPETARHWGQVANGAQLADLVRLEALLRWGGIYVDQDVEPYRSLEPLLPLSAFAAWEDERVVPNAVLGAVPGHPAIRECLDLALSRVPGDTWKAGPGVTTQVLPGRSDVLVLPPGSFYPYHYRQKERAGDDHQALQPWAFVAHHWWGSWLTSS